MTITDLSDYNLGELKGLLLEIDNELRRRRFADMHAARAQIAAIAQETGLTVDDLLRSRLSKPKRS